MKAHLRHEPLPTNYGTDLVDRGLRHGEGELIEGFREGLGVHDRTVVLPAMNTPVLRIGGLFMRAAGSRRRSRVVPASHDLPAVLSPRRSVVPAPNRTAALCTIETQGCLLSSMHAEWIACLRPFPWRFPSPTTTWASFRSFLWMMRMTGLTIPSCMGDGN